MYKLTFAALAVSLITHGSSSLAGSFVNGNGLLEMCTVDREDALYFQKVARCSGYVAGIADALANNPVNRYRACLPKQATVGQITDVVKLQLERHPELRHMAAAGLVAEALSIAFPCR